MIRSAVCHNVRLTVAISFSFLQWNLCSICCLLETSNPASRIVWRQENNILWSNFDPRGLLRRSLSAALACRWFDGRTTGEGGGGRVTADAAGLLPHFSCPPGGEIEFQIMLLEMSVRPLASQIFPCLRRCGAQDSWRLYVACSQTTPPTVRCSFPYFQPASSSLTRCIPYPVIDVIGRIVSKWVRIIGRSAHLCPSWPLPVQGGYPKGPDPRERVDPRPADLIPTADHRCRRRVGSHCSTHLSTSSRS